MTPKSLPSIASSVAHAACLIPALWTTGHHQMGMDHKFYSHPLSPQGEIPMWGPKMNPKMNGSNQKTRVSGRYLYKAQREHQLFSSRRFHQNIVCKAGAQLSDFFPVATLGLQDWGSSHTPNRRCPLPVAPPIPARCLPVAGFAIRTAGWPLPHPGAQAGCESVPRARAARRLGPTALRLVSGHR